MILRIRYTTWRMYYSRSLIYLLWVGKEIYTSNNKKSQLDSSMGWWDYVGFVIANKFCLAKIFLRKYHLMFAVHKTQNMKNREMHVYYVQWFMWIYCVLTSLAFHPIILFMAQFVFILIVSDLRAQLKKPLVSFCVFFFPVGVLYQNCTSVSFVHPTMGIIYKQIKITRFYLHPSFSYCL